MMQLELLELPARPCASLRAADPEARAIRGVIAAALRRAAAGEQHKAVHAQIVAARHSGQCCS